MRVLSSLYHDFVRRVVDALDFWLLGALIKEPLATHASLARAIGRSSSAVRKRLTALTATGVLRGFDAIPAAEVLGMRGLGAGWDAASAFGDILAVEGTVWVADTIQGQTAALGYARDPQTWLDAVSERLGKPPFLRAPINPYDGPVLGPLDLRILRAMIDAPVVPADELATLCGLSARTVRARRDAMLKNNAVRIEPIIRTERTSATAYYVYIASDKSVTPRVVKALREAVVFSDDGGIACLFCHASTLHEKAERLAEVRALGVEPTEVVQKGDSKLNRQAIVAMIDHVLTPWDAAKAPGKPRRPPPIGV